MIMCFGDLEAQKEYQFPVIKNFGGIYAIDEATVIPVVDHRYDIVIVQGFDFEGEFDNGNLTVNCEGRYLKN